MLVPVVVPAPNPALSPATVPAMLAAQANSNETSRRVCQLLAQQWLQKLRSAELNVVPLFNSSKQAVAYTGTDYGYDSAH